jgi:hypothetical protein
MVAIQIRSFAALAVGYISETKALKYSEYHIMTPLEPVTPDKKNVDWFTGADNFIHWGVLPVGTKSVTFSR